MKRFTYQKSKLALFCLLTLTVFFNACQHEDHEDITGRASDSTTTTGLLPSGNCETDCIVPGGPYFETQDSRIVTWGGRYNDANSKTVEIKYYNTETHFVLQVKSTNGWSDLLINEQSVWTGGHVAPNVWQSYSYLLPPGWKACDPIDFDLKVAGNGQPAVFDNVLYNLIGICDDGCETSFTGEAISCDDTREAIYTFTADADQDYIKIQGGLTNFTGEDAVIAFLDEEGNEIENLDNLVVSQRSPGGSSNRVITVEGSVSECETITIRIRWNSDNGGDVITGEWSVKDENGLELADPITGLQCH
ncbi:MULTISPECIES: hypothetical protein [Flavobacterium]|uniref:hypothetical protein n=1 Tax=Flavobacterium TaxID=237 RepID=UPI001FCADC6F|nr:MULTISPECIES: hypothetical protein [Flavobacterium]UOK41820.1 hypothetical protein LZF87_10930 [Flavobacterium enshiense]